MDKEKNHIWYVDIIAKVPLRIGVLAETKEEASSRALGGAWHNVIKYDTGHAEVIAISDNIAKGPKVN